MPKMLVFDNATLCADGSIGIKWLKVVTDPDDGSVLSQTPHRTMVDFDGDVDAQIDAVAVNLAGYAFDAQKMKKLIRKLDAIGRAEPEINARRAAKIEERKKVDDELRARQEMEEAAVKLLKRELEQQ